MFLSLSPSLTLSPKTSNFFFKKENRCPFYKCKGTGGRAQLDMRPPALALAASNDSSSGARDWLVSPRSAQWDQDAAAALYLGRP